MSTTGTDLIPRSTIEQIVGYRDAALKLYAEAHNAIAAADAKIKEAHAMAQRAYLGEVNGYTYDQSGERQGTA
jgi:hypothetical protein